MLPKVILSAGFLSILLVSATPSRADSLRDAMAYAYENSPAMASAFMDVRAAVQAIRLNEGGTLPTVGATASVSGSWTDTPPPLSSDQFSTSGSIGLSYNQTLFDNFKTDAAVSAAKARYDAATFAAVNTEQNVLLNVATAHFNVISNRRLVQIRGENISFLEAQLRAARDGLELGEGIQLGVAQAQAALAQGQAVYQAAQANLLAAEASYLRFVGRDPAIADDAAGIARLLPADVDAALAIAITEHPGLQASAAAIRAAIFQSEETKASFGPELSLSAQSGVGGMTSDTWTLSGQVSLRLAIPIYVPARDPALEQANIARVQSELEARVTHDVVSEAIRQAWAGLSSATMQIEAATAAVAAGQLALQAVMDQNEMGSATTLDVLDARGKLLQSEEALVSAQTQRSIAGYSLLAAMGRLTADNLSLPVQMRAADGSVVPSQTGRQLRHEPSDPWTDLR